MALSAVSTSADIEAAFLDSMSYDADGSPDKCRAFIAACRGLLLRRPSTASRGASDSSQAFTWSMESIKAELDAARQWLAFAPVANGGDNTVHPDFSNLRDQAGWADGRTYGTDA
jgi:hypothetical protein